MVLGMVLAIDDVTGARLVGWPGCSTGRIRSGVFPVTGARATLAVFGGGARALAFLVGVIVAAP